MHACGQVRGERTNARTRADIRVVMMRQEKESVYVIKRTREEADVQDESYGYVDFKEGEEKIGWMVTYSQVRRR